MDECPSILATFGSDTLLASAITEAKLCRAVCVVRFFFNTAKVGNLFQVAVHLLIAGNGQQSSFIHAVRIILILFKYLFGNAQKRDVTEVVCLFTGFHYPQITVAVLGNMFGVQIIHVYECQPGIYAKR